MLRSALAHAGSWTLIVAGCSTTPALPPHELSMRFTHPELYAGRDDFARENALSTMLRLRILRRGMTADEILSLLGPPDRCHAAGEEESADSSYVLGKPFVWHYERLQSSNFHIEFDAGEAAARFVWDYDEGPYVERVDVW